jgi:hypothetical protein
MKRRQRRHLDDDLTDQRDKTFLWLNLQTFLYVESHKGLHYGKLLPLPKI